jgi:hypothetical protein
VIVAHDLRKSPPVKASKPGDHSWEIDSTVAGSSSVGDSEEVDAEPDPEKDDEAQAEAEIAASSKVGRRQLQRMNQRASKCGRPEKAGKSRTRGTGLPDAPVKGGSSFPPGDRPRPSFAHLASSPDGDRPRHNFLGILRVVEEAHGRISPEVVSPKLPTGPPGHWQRASRTAEEDVEAAEDDLARARARVAAAEMRLAKAKAVASPCSSRSSPWASENTSPIPLAVPIAVPIIEVPVLVPVVVTEQMLQEAMPPHYED